MASSTNADSGLLQLPNSLLGCICGKLGSGADRRAFMHTCKELHDNPECLSKITTMAVFTSKQNNGILDRQLGTVIRGNAITRMIVDNSSDRYMDVVSPILAAFPLEAHRQLLGQITHLELNDCSFSSRHVFYLADCLRSCMPSLRHLTLRRPRFLDYGGNFSAFSRLGKLSSFSVLQYGCPRLATCLAHWPHLTELSLTHLPTEDYVVTSRKIRTFHLGSCHLGGLPTRLTLPSLTRLRVDTLRCALDNYVDAHAHAADALAALHGVAIECGELVIHGAHWLSGEMFSCAKVLDLFLSHPCCVPTGVQRIVCDSISFLPEQLSHLASMFGGVKELFFDRCCFAPSSMRESLLGFPELTSVVVHGLENEERGSPHSFESFNAGVLEVCSAAQASRRRNAEMLTISFWSKHQGYGLSKHQATGLRRTADMFETQLADAAEPEKVSLLVL